MELRTAALTRAASSGIVTTTALGLLKLARLRRLKNSARNCRLRLSRIGVFLSRRNPTCRGRGAFERVAAQVSVESARERVHLKADINEGTLSDGQLDIRVNFIRESGQPAAKGT